MNIKLHEAIFSTKSEINHVECSQLGGIVVPLIKLNNYDAYIYGGGGFTTELILYLWNNDISVKAIIDADEAKRGQILLDEVPIIHTSDLHLIDNANNSYVIINTSYFNGIERNRIISLLNNAGINKWYDVMDFDKHYMYPNRNSKGRIIYYREHENQLYDTYNLLCDQKSKDVMTEYIRAYCSVGTYKLPECDGRVKYYYGNTQEDGSYEELYYHKNDEVVLDCGASIGDNIFLYYANGLSAKKYYAVEGDKTTYNILKQNISLLPEKIRGDVEPICTFIGEDTIYDDLFTEKISLIKADIEGYEADLLGGLKQIIIKDRPVIAICAYHKKEDLIVLPEMINNMVDDYHYMLRKYPTADYTYRTDEIVVYAIPNERSTREVLRDKI